MKRKSNKGPKLTTKIPIILTACASGVTIVAYLYNDELPKYFWQVAAEKLSPLMTQQLVWVPILVTTAFAGSALALRQKASNGKWRIRKANETEERIFLEIKNDALDAFVSASKDTSKNKFDIVGHRLLYLQTFCNDCSDLFTDYHGRRISVSFKALSVDGKSVTAVHRDRRADSKRRKHTIQRDVLCTAVDKLVADAPSREYFLENDIRKNRPDWKSSIGGDFAHYYNSILTVPVQYRNDDASQVTRRGHQPHSEQIVIGFLTIDARSIRFDEDVDVVRLNKFAHALFVAITCYHIAEERCKGHHAEFTEAALRGSLDMHLPSPLPHAAE